MPIVPVVSLQGFGNQVLALQTSRVYEAFGF